MSDKAREIQRAWYDMVKACPLTTMEVWAIEGEIQDILYDKGYGFVNFHIAPCRYGRFNSITCLTRVAGKLTSQLKANGYNIIVQKNPNRPSETWIIFPYNLTHDIRSCVETFEVIK